MQRGGFVKCQVRFSAYSDAAGNSEANWNEDALTHTVTHMGKRADGNNGTNRLRPHPFWTKNRRKALCSKGWKALRQLVRMRSAVRIRPAAPKSPVFERKQDFSLLFGGFDSWVRGRVNFDPHRDPHGEMLGKGKR